MMSRLTVVQCALVVLVAALCGVAPVHARAATKTVTVGVILPLSGDAASVGAEGKAAVEVALDVINKAHSSLGNLLLAKGAGLTNLGGAKLKVVFADSQGSPVVGQSQALRLITQDHVVALQGAYQSGVTSTASAVAERRGVPFVNGASTSPTLTKRGFKWFFRCTPVGSDISGAYVKFLQYLKDHGHKVDSIAIVYSNTEYGKGVAKGVTHALKASGLDVSLEIPYSKGSASVRPEVLRLKQEKPDVAIFLSYTSDAILFAKTMKSLDYKPPIMIADDSGFSDPAFVKSVGSLAQGLLNRSAWSNGKPGSPAYRINAMYKQKIGHNLDASSARIMQAFFVMANAINQAGSTDPHKIQAALRATDIKPDQLIVAYNGVKFDGNGNNTLASTAIVQLQGSRYLRVFPLKRAQAKLELPYKGW